MNKKIRGVICVNCGENATKGSIQHPYCKKCFKNIFNDDHEKYFKVLGDTHNKFKFFSFLYNPKHWNSYFEKLKGKEK